MAAILEPLNAEVLYGTKGPDKWSFQMEGILDRTYDGRYHEFTIDGKEARIAIKDGRPLAAWQCPPHPAINPDRHDYEWSEAWEFSGVGSIVGIGQGYEVLAIYSPRSRKGVFHFWPIALAGHQDCSGCRRDLHQFFADRTNSVALLAMTRAMEHMVRGSALGGYHVDCEPCWGLFRDLRRSCELP
jgi:hypothetical protein